jgi:hypothetical protein
MANTYGTTRIQITRQQRKHPRGVMESVRPHRYTPHDPTRWAPPNPRIPLNERLAPDGQAILGASLTVEEVIADGFTPDHPEPDRKGKGWDKGKRE